MPDFVQSRALPDFCAAVVNRHGSAWPPNEGQLAEDFLAYFGTARLGTFDGLVKWCGEVGVDVSTMVCFPHDLRGANFWHEKNMSIVMPLNGGCFISREHTLLHEVRELLEGILVHLGHPTSEGPALESRAEQFAACVRMAVGLELSKDLFGLAGGVRDPFGRVCAFGLVGVAALALLLGSVEVRRLETLFDAKRRNSAT